MRIVYFGTPQIAVKSLEYLINKDDTDIICVVTQPDKPAGRGNMLVAPPVKLCALEHNIKILQPHSIKNDREIIERLKEISADLFITFAFGQILSKEIIDIPRLGIINLHASLLPKYRGANPIQRAIFNGEALTGITTMQTNIGMDTGDILLKKEIEITENMTSVELTKIISEISPEVIYKTIIGLDNNTIIPIKQNDADATKANKFHKENGKIDWNKTAKEIHNQVRGMKPWPSTYSYYNEIMVKITETNILNETSDKPPGQILNIDKEGMQIAASQGIILVKKVQPEGKKEMTAQEWCNGSRIKVGDKFLTV